MKRLSAVIAALFSITAQEASAATLHGISCETGIKAFPFLKPWVEKFDDFEAPVRVGAVGASVYYAIGATLLRRGGADRWIKDSAAVDVNWKKRAGKLETSLLGARLSRSFVDEKGPWSGFWSRLFSSHELELLSKCDKKDCKVKFNPSELQEIIAVSGPDRSKPYRAAVKKRIEEFESKGHLWAYEGTEGPLSWSELRLGQDFPSAIGERFWLPRERGGFGYEVLDAEPGRHKPVTALFSRQCERRGQGASAYSVCTDFVVYNNHYFDFWGRIVLFFPWCGSEIAMAYEAADIDQLKGAGMARVLFGVEMRKLLEILLETRLHRLRSIGA